MERYAWKGYILPGQRAEYIRRHDEIWPDMTQALQDAGIHNYSIWNVGDELFGYYECESVASAAQSQARSEVVARWDVYMKDVLRMATEEGALQQVFYHE